MMVHSKSFIFYQVFHTFLSLLLLKISYTVKFPHNVTTVRFVPTVIIISVSHTGAMFTTAKIHLQ